MPDEGFGQFNARLRAAGLVHLLVQGIEVGFGMLAAVGEAGFAFALLGGGKVHIMGGMKMLGLLAGQHLEVKELELAVHFELAVVH